MQYPSTIEEAIEVDSEEATVTIEVANVEEVTYHKGPHKDDLNKAPVVDGARCWYYTKVGHVRKGC